jgi:hypothetical protein
VDWIGLAQEKNRWRALMNSDSIKCWLSSGLTIGGFSSNAQLQSVSQSVSYNVHVSYDRLCGLVVRVLGYRSGGPGLIPGTTGKKM